MVEIYVGTPEPTTWTLHEKLLCYHSPFFARIFYDKKANTRPGVIKEYGLENEDDETFQLFVGWLYSRAIKFPSEESEIGHLLDLYLLSEKLEIEKLQNDVVDTVRQFYHSQNSYPGLRRVQYIYANTGDDNTMREMMVGSVARYLTLADSIPAHWDRALRNNGRLAVDIIRSIQEWHLEGRSVPDARDGSVDRGRSLKFSTVEGEAEGDSFESSGLKEEEEAEE